MKICVIGAGYVGLSVGACFAKMGNEVICVDNDEEKLNQLKNGIIPIYEPALEDLIKVNVSENRLSFTNDIKTAVEKSLVCFITVGTLNDKDGSADLKYFYQAAESIAKSINDYKVIVNKSTVPVGTANKVTEIIKAQTNIKFDVVSNPEFLKQGSAVEDFLNPDRIIIGSDSKKAVKIIKELYAPFLQTETPVIIMDVKSAEMTKYAANSFLAVKISYANQIANICEKVGADAQMVRKGMSLDKRIGSEFLFCGLGYGGSCFSKDIKALSKTAIDNNCDYSILKAADEINKKQRLLFIEKIYNRFNKSLLEKTFAIWGLSFKPKTNDMREAPSITVINALLDAGAKVQAFDPKAFKQARFYFGDKIIYSKSAYEACKSADCLLLLTEWDEFKHPDFNKIKSLMKSPIIFDGRNQYNEKQLIKQGFEYVCIGKQNKFSF